MGRLVQSALADAAGGAAAGAIADGVLYSIDSWKVRTQTKPDVTSGKNNIRILFRGLGPTVMLGSVPVFGCFFCLYSPLRILLQESSRPEYIPLASALCAVPATMIGVPADVLKKRLVLGIDKNFRVALRRVILENGVWRGLFAGWNVNLIRDLPFAGIKIGLYELFVNKYSLLYPSRNGENISATGAAICGIASGVFCGILTCPLDVVNTRIKADSMDSTSILKVTSQIVSNEGVSALFRGVALRSFVLGVGSFIFWPIQRTVAQNLQPTFP